MDKRTWCIRFGIEAEWVTEEDKDFYVQAVASGQQVIVLRDGRVFSPRFTKISSRSHMENNKHLEAGQWQCGTGTWHNKGVECFCEHSYQFEGGVARELASGEAE